MGPPSQSGYEWPREYPTKGSTLGKKSIPHRQRDRTPTRSQVAASAGPALRPAHYPSLQNPQRASSLTLLILGIQNDQPVDSLRTPINWIDPSPHHSGILPFSTPHQSGILSPAAEAGSITSFKSQRAFLSPHTCSTQPLISMFPYMGLCWLLRKTRRQDGHYICILAKCDVLDQRIVWPGAKSTTGRQVNSYMFERCVFGRISWEYR